MAGFTCVTDSQRRFYKSDLYKSVKKRKRKLLEMLAEQDMQSWDEILPLTQVFKEYDLDDLIDFLKKNQDKEHPEYELDPYSSRIQVTTPKGKSVHDFICIEYFRLYRISEDKSKIQRYSYIECYYDEYVLACIMDTGDLRKAGAFVPLTMDKSDWGHAQQQMKLWNRYLLPKIEEFPAERDKYVEEMLQRLTSREDLEDTECNEGNQYPAVENPAWIVTTYLHLMQVLPLLPKDSVPCYYLNLVCSDKEAQISLAEKLETFLGAYFQDDPVIQGRISVRENFSSPKTGNPYSHKAVPYLLVVKKQKDLQPLRELMNDHDWTTKAGMKHPLRNSIPICINDQRIVDSTALNIHIADPRQLRWDDHLINRMWENISQLPPSCWWRFNKTHIRDFWASKRQAVLWYGEEMDIAQKYEVRIQDNPVRSVRNLIELAAWFLAPQYRGYDEDELDGAQKEWLEAFLRDLAEKQQNLDTTVDELMQHFRKQHEQLRDVRPPYTGRSTKEEMMFREGNLLCYHPSVFAERVKVFKPYADCDAVLHRMKDRGYLKTHKGKNLYYVINLDDKSDAPRKRKSVDYYAIIIE